jgi:DNA repair ATPase RecN
VHESKEKLHEAFMQLKESKNRLTKTRDAHKKLMKEYEFLNDLQDVEAFSLEIKDWAVLEKRIKRDWDIERL